MAAVVGAAGRRLVSLAARAATTTQCARLPKSAFYSSRQHSHGHPHAHDVATPTSPRIGSLGIALPDAVASKLTTFPSTVSIPMQWGFQDGYGHVNNVHYMRFLETARMQYFLDVQRYLEGKEFREFIDAKTIGPILATASIAYKFPVTFPDTVTVGARVSEIKSDRFNMSYIGVSHKTGRVVCEGDSWIVTYDYRILRKAPLPAHILAAIQKHNGLS